MNTKLLTGILALALLTTGTALACDEDHGGHHGEMRKMRRSGELTKEEREELRGDFKKHKELREQLKADGGLSDDDKTKLKESREALKKHAKELASNDQKREKKAAKKQ